MSTCVPIESLNNLHKIESKKMSKTTHQQIRFTPGMTMLFFILAFASTWIVLIPALASVPIGRLTPFFMLAAFGPFFSAIIVVWTCQGRSVLLWWLGSVFRLRIPAVLYLAGAFVLPIGVGALHYVLYNVLGGIPDFSDAIPWYLYLFYLLPTAALTGGNEEPGWRGFALPALLQWFHPALASIILGTIHAAWHLPLMNYYDTSFELYLFNVVGLTFILNWLYFKSRGSVIPVMLFHGGTNVIDSFIPTPTDVLGGLGTFMFLRGIVYWAIAIVLLIITKGWLGSRSTDFKTKTYWHSTSN